MPSWRQRLDAALPPTAQGVLGILAGTLLLVWPGPALRTVEVIVGIALLGHAAIDANVLRGPDGGRGRRWRLLGTVAEVGVAVLVLGWPGISQVALLYALGSTAVLLGGIEVASLSSGAHGTRERWLGGASGAAAFIFGMAMIGTAQRDVHTVVTLVGVYLVVTGALRVLRTVHPRRGVVRTPGAEAA
jgi:uncharacterized membrane protein HdeD (DUF308 family)